MTRRSLVMAVDNTFVGLDVETLTLLKADFIACLRAIAVAGQNYSVAQRQFTRADLAEVKKTIADIQYALDLAAGRRARVTIDNFNPNFRR